VRIRPVTSTTVSGLGYDEASSTLEVHFTSGAVYQYLEVPPAVFADFMHAPSKGQYLNYEIKNSYRYVRIIDAARSPAEGRARRRPRKRKR
jgi:hypothetical protein